MSEYDKCSGICDEKFAGVRQAFEKNLKDLDVGASVAVTVNGEFVVDLWGGLADQATQTPWTEDTIVNVFFLDQNHGSSVRVNSGGPGTAGFECHCRQLLAGVRSKR